MPHHLTNRFPSEESRSEREFNNRETILPHPEFFWSVTFRCSSRVKKKIVTYLPLVNIFTLIELQQKGGFTTEKQRRVTGFWTQASSVGRVRDYSIAHTLFMACYRAP